VVDALLRGREETQTASSGNKLDIMKDKKMAKTYFGFGVAPSMFPAVCEISKRGLTPDQAKGVIEEGVEPCLNPSHKASIDAMRSRFGIEVGIPEKAPSVKLVAGDRLLVMGVSGLPRLEGRHEYTTDEVAGARFDFSLWTV
jgi:hypothetical protein